MNAFCFFGSFCHRGTQGNECFFVFILFFCSLPFCSFATGEHKVMNAFWNSFDFCCCCSLSLVGFFCSLAPITSMQHSLHSILRMHASCGEATGEHKGMNAFLDFFWAFCGCRSLSLSCWLLLFACSPQASWHSRLHAVLQVTPSCDECSSSLTSLFGVTVCVFLFPCASSWFGSLAQR